MMINFSPDVVFLWGLGIKATLVLLLGFFAAGVLRRKSARLRSLLWMCVFSILIVLPLSFWVMPVWTWGIPDFEQRSDLTEANDQKVSLLTEAVVATAGRVDADSSVLYSVNSESVKGIGLIGVVAVVYGVGVFWVLLRRVIGELMVGRLTLHPAEKRAAMLLQRVGAQLPLRRRVQLVCCDEIGVAMTWGVFRPVIALPRESVKWDDEVLQAAILHELAHVIHFDAAKRWLAMLVTAMFWVHPLVWVAVRHWRLEQERSCDDVVLRFDVSAEVYARQLIEAAKMFRFSGLAATVAMAMPAGLEQRVRCIVNGNVNRAEPSRFIRSGALVLTVMVMSVGLFSQAQSPEKSQKLDDQKADSVTLLDDQAGSDSSDEMVSSDILISAQFIEINEGQLPILPDVLSRAKLGETVVLRADEQLALVRKLAQKKGVDLLALPKVKSVNPYRQYVRTELIREFFYPTEFEMEKGLLTPTAFQMLPIGIIVRGSAKPLPDGRIAVTDFRATVNEFHGYIVTGVGGLESFGPNKWLFDESRGLLGVEHVVTGEMTRMGQGFGHRSASRLLSKLALKKDEAGLPLFVKRQWTVDVTVSAGEWYLFCLNRLVGRPDLYAGRQVWCLMSAEMVR